ncbi:MAG TPA: BON domain-containing protein [Gemmataceae bacterium]|nr:BON domain-containing protein [Gemmataceae bacterium]
MFVPSRFHLALAAGLCMLHPALGGTAEPSSPEPSQLPIASSSNQQIADTIAAQLRASGLLRHYDVDISCREGAVELRGSVADAGQREQVVHLVQRVPGVERVVDHLTLAGAIVPVQAGGAPAALQPVPPANPTPPPPPAGAVAPPGAAPPEATPIFQAPAPAPHALNAPRMPPYAWPTYAPYNNYSRVAYPQAYPYNSWPFIGPMYPFPKVPPGWRSVKLEWDDGFWWYSKTATKRDWWKLRFY